jgi:hypothetical protein
MVRFCGILSASVLLLCGCAEASKPAAPTANGPRAASSESAAAAENSPPEDAAATSAVPAGETPAAPAESKTDATSGAKELNLEVISFTAPGTWKQVKPANNIIEAEFELPRAAGDEYDGRLTLMSAGGDPEDIIGRRTAEFDRDADDAPKRETLSIGSVEATWLDLRGTWRGSTFQPLNPPRAEYRMLFVIIPFTEQSAFYAKLVGPKETIAAREDEFRAFIKSARLKPR